MTQQIRPSQFIFTYGPGAILESPSGPVIVKDLLELIGDLTGKGKGDLSKIEIQDQRFTSGRLHPEIEMDGPWKILRIPSNAELGWAEGKMVYPVTGFPNWSFCTQKHGGEPEGKKRAPIGILYESRDGCPECKLQDHSERQRKAGREAYRFVRACQNGHLDDVPWVGFLHRGPASCGAKYVLVRGHGGGLEEIQLFCPVKDCTAHKGRPLIDLYKEPWKCSGRHPHRNKSSACNMSMTLQQRGALSLFQPEVVTSLTLEPVSARVVELAHRLLANFRTTVAALDLDDTGLAAFSREKWAKIFCSGLLGHKETESKQFKSLTDEILSDWDGLYDMLLQFDGRKATDNRPRREAEFDRLMKASVDGAPVVKAQRKGDPPLFEVRKEKLQSVSWGASWGDAKAGPRLWAAPVSRLREVAVQAGFRRMVAKSGEVPKLVSCCEDPHLHKDVLYRFFPGVERYGEGVFLRFDDGVTLKTDGPRWASWLSRWDAEMASGSPWDLEKPFRHPIHPMEVWWHTLSHRLIRALSIDAGYSSSALRERLFFTPATSEAPMRSGLLIYAVQSGGDGTLGGLTSLVPNLGSILDSAVEDLDACSNGPVCDEGGGSEDGAACYACLYASETSCEFRNRGLDRLLLLETLS